MLICCGLYDLLRGVLLLLPDLMLEEVMDKLIQPESLIVLVNHSSPLIQQGVMKVCSVSYLVGFMYCKAGRADLAPAVKFNCTLPLKCYLLWKFINIPKSHIYTIVFKCILLTSIFYFSS